MFYVSSLVVLRWTRYRKILDDCENRELMWRDTASRDAMEMVCIVDQNNEIVPNGACKRSLMRLENKWHRATYVLIIHDPEEKKSHQNKNSEEVVNHHEQLD